MSRDLAPGSGKKPNLHIAHRRSPSELTTLMVEQYNLQRQLEEVQAQQKQILQQQQMNSPRQYTYPPQEHRGHSRNSSLNAPSTHRRTGSNTGPSQGHARRHSLGLNEAIKAAANQRQSNRSSLSPSTPTNNGNDTISFKFPADADEDSGRSRSLAYGQQSFKFPAGGSPESSSNTGNSLLPPTPNFSIAQSPDRSHQRRSSHYRSNSRNFDPNGAVNMNGNWRAHQRSNSGLEPPTFVPGHKPRNSSYGGGGSISSISSFSNPGGNSSNNANSNGRKSLFAPYLPQSSLPELINDGRLVVGTLRVNKKNRSDAYVSTYGLLDADIFICGSKDRNRALEGDLVAVELLVVDEVWESKKEKEEKKRRKDNTLAGKTYLNDDIHNDATSAISVSPKQGDEGEGGDATTTLGRRGSLKQRPTMKKNDDVEVEGQSLLLVEEEEINDDVKPLYAGHVVAVVDRIPGQLFAGTLGLLRPAQAAQAAKDKKNGKESSVQTPRAPKIVWFKPTDKKVPLIAIPTDQAPKDFVENHERYANELFVASIKRWPITSLHPFGTLVSKLGKIEDPATEIDSILRDNNFLCDEYAGDETFELPSIEPELAAGHRTEYLDDYVIAFTQNGQFVDHAMHVKRLSETKIELVFHVVDMAYFVRPGSMLDRKAKKRFTSIFLPQRTTHLYPEQVLRTVSFKENSRKLAVSVVFEIDCTNFEVEDLYIHESVVAAKQVVSYDEVDAILHKEREGTRAADISSALQDYVRTFGLIAKEFRRQRLESPSLGLDPNLTLMDQLDDEKVRLDLNVFKDSPAFDMVSEIAHKVNGAIAAKVHAGLGDKAFLRCHPLPTLSKLETFVRKAGNLGFRIDTTSASTLQKSVLAIEDPVKRQIVETLLFKCMSRGKYYVAGKQDPDSFGHYYFNVPLYTHFNAPVRRYADLIVHRQLKQVLAKQDDDRELDSLKTIADYCNFKKDCAANAQQQAIHLLLSQTINEISEDAGQLLVMGTIVQVYESAFDVFIPEFGVEKRVHGDQLPLVKAEFDKNERVLELFWEKGVDAATYVPPDEQSSLSYRTSIKNKHRTSAAQAAEFQKKQPVESIADKLASMSLSLPELRSPKGDADKGSLGPYLENLETRMDGDSCVQVVRELQEVPVLIRAEIGMALPCLTVRVLNPFA